MRKSAILILAGMFLFAAPAAYGAAPQDASSPDAPVSALAEKTYNSAEGFDPKDGIYVKAQKDLYWQGRYSNDRVFSEYLAKNLTGRFNNLENYAVGGAFSGVLTGSVATGDDRSNWSSWLKGWGGVEQTERFVADHAGVAPSDGLYIISTGGNDEYAAYTLGYAGAVSASVTCIAEMVTTLADAGATDFIIMEQTTRPGKTESTFTGLHRTALESWYATYAPAHPALEIVLLDANNLYADMVFQGDTAYGYQSWGFSLISDWVPAYGYAYVKDDNTDKLPTDASEDIYGYGYYYSNVLSPLNPYYDPSISGYDADDFLSYDEYHLSGRSQRHLASYILDDDLDVGGGSTFALVYGGAPSAFASSALSSNTYTKIYTFGDSSIDCGKANEITTALVNARGTAPTITTASLPNGTVNAAYNQSLAATGTAPFAWTVDSGALPAGLSLSTSGAISGTPTTEGVFDFTVKVANSASPDATKTLRITINKAMERLPAPVDINKATLATAIPNTAWTGGLITPALSLKYADKTLVKNTDYTVAYKANKNIGQATATISGKGQYTGVKSVTFKIVPKKPSVKKLTPKKKSLAVTWNKVSAAQKVTKYQIRYSISGKAWKTRTVPAASKSITIKKLTKGKKYQVQIRTYKTVSGKNYYSGWSKVKTSKKVK
ncbi:MAG: putative Ig domain-containing protein [Clostridiales Family XIII bacterium]|nr:putative Ig domain-containing protein [Clostridiales Family XIII bacterium]